MRNTIAQYVLRQQGSAKTQKQKVSEINKILRKYNIPKKVLHTNYNNLHHKNQIPYVTFCYKLRMFTFTDAELTNVSNIVDSAVSAIEKENA